MSRKASLKRARQRALARGADPASVAMRPAPGNPHEAVVDGKVVPSDAMAEAIVRAARGEDPEMLAAEMEQVSAEPVHAFGDQVVSLHPALKTEYRRQAQDFEDQTGQHQGDFPMDPYEIDLPLAVFCEITGKAESTTRRNAEKLGGRKVGRKWVFPASLTRTD